MDDLEQENGSLFGSPPASPSRRSTPPGPVLPGSANVGPIALVGSHNHAELDMRFPAAASTALSASQQPLFHSAPRASASLGTIGPRRSSRVATRGTIGSPSTPGPSSGTNIPPRRKRGTRPETAPPPLKIALPLPGESTPSNFFRNQPGLLGYAGVIGGVHPANLPQPHAIGRTRENPISLSDDQADDSDEESDSNTEPPAPTQAEVLQALVKDREAVGTLTEILRLAAENKKFGSADVDETRPAKRRRTDQSSDARIALQNNQVRLKRMISRLVVLIQEAARRATRDLVIQRTGHYRPATASYGQSTEQVDKVTPELGTPGPDQSMDLMGSLPPSEDLFGDVPISAFDDFMASLTTEGFDSPFNLNPVAPTHSASTETPLSVTPSADLNLNNLDHLLGLLQTLPQAGAEPMQVDTPSIDSPALSLPAGWEIDPALLVMDPPNTLAQLTAQPSSLQIGSLSSASTPGMIDSPMTSITSPLDPATPQWDTLFPDPTMSNKDVDLRKYAFRNSANQNAYLGFFAPASLDVQGSLTASLHDLYVPTVPFAPSLEPAVTPVQANTSNLIQAGIPNVDIISTSSMMLPLPSVPPPPLTTANPHLPPPPVTVVSPRAAARRVASARGKGAMYTQESRSSVLKRAMERKKLLEVELERARVELWEATIEAGTLTHLLKASL